MRNKQYLLSALFPVMLISCYHEVDLDEYRDKIHLVLARDKHDREQG